MPIRVLVVDDHTLVRQGVQQLLETADDIAVVATAADGAQAQDQVRAHDPDVVLMDLSMPRVGGLAATRSIVAEHPDVRVIALTQFRDARHVLASVRAGAVGYHLKDFDADTLIEAVRTAARGGTTYDPWVAGFVAAIA